MKKIAVHLHIYYQDQVPALLEKLKSLSGLNYQLFVTLAKESADITNKILAQEPTAEIWKVENRGYDVGPFIDFLHKIDLDKWDYILKLHTKGKKSTNYAALNGWQMNNRIWGSVLYDSLLRNKERVRSNLALLFREDVGMIGSAYCVVDKKKISDKLLPQINEELKKLNFEETQTCCFVAGTMFMAKAFLFKPFLKYQISDFNETNGVVKDKTLAHILERLFGEVVILQGKRIEKIKHDPFYYLCFIFVGMYRFFYQKKITTSGRLIIKICKIPVYRKSV